MKVQDFHIDFFPFWIKTSDFKFYIKKCCELGLRGNNCNYPHPAPCKKYIENPENGCRPECTNFHPDICKYSRKLRKCYNVNCYRIHLKGTIRKRSPQVQQHALSRPQTNQFQNPYCPANSTFENKPHKTTCSFNPPNSTRPSISSYTYSRNPILPYSHSLTTEVLTPKLPAILIT